MYSENLRSKLALQKWLSEQDPYAFVTIRLNKINGSSNQEHLHANQLKRLMRDLSLLLDERFHGTRYVVERVPRYKRFEAICVPEKLDRSPHLHCLFFTPKGNFLEKDEDERLAFLIQEVSTDLSNLGDREWRCLRTMERGELRPIKQKALKVIAPQTDGDVRVVHSKKKLIEYTTKCYNVGASKNVEDFFILSEFHSTKQRLEAL